MDRLITSCIHIHDNKVTLNGRIIFYQENSVKFADFIKAVFKQEQVVYPKFYKMDAVSKLGFLATELVLKRNKLQGYQPGEIGVVFSNSSSSLDTDISHNETIKDRSAYFPSPSVFVYTLPNIVIGEVCIRHDLKGENAFLISETFNGQMLVDYVEELFESKRVEACLCGWIEVIGNNYNGMVALVENSERITNVQDSGFKPILFNDENLNLIMKM